MRTCTIESDFWKEIEVKFKRQKWSSKLPVMLKEASMIGNQLENQVNVAIKLP